MQRHGRSRVANAAASSGGIDCKTICEIGYDKASAAHHGESCAGDVNPPTLLSGAHRLHAPTLRNWHISVYGTRVKDTLNRHAFQIGCICTEGPGRLQGEFYTETRVASLSSL